MSRGWWLWLCALACVLGLSSVALAHIGQERPRLEGRKRPDVVKEGPRGVAVVVLPDGASELTLTRSQAGFTGTFQVENRGAGPLEIFRVGALAEEGPPRAAGAVGISSTARESQPLPPGETRSFTVVWRGDQSLSRQFEMLLVVESDSAQPGSDAYDPSPTFRVRADRRPWWQRGLLFWALGIPAAWALLSLVARAHPAFSSAHHRILTILGASLHVLAGLVGLTTFVRGQGREHGGWGLQHVDQLSIGGLDVLVAADGLVIGMLPVLGAIWLALSLSRDEAEHAHRRAALSAGLVAGATLFLVSQSLVLSGVGLAVAALCTVGAAFARVDGEGPSAASGARAAVVSTLSLSLLGFAAMSHALVRHAEPSVTGLADRFAIPELARHALHGHLLDQASPEVLGMAPERWAALMSLVAFLPLLGAVPFQSWLASAGSRLCNLPMLGALSLLPLLGTVGLLRFGFALFPAEMSWVSSALRIVGLLTVAASALAALGAKDPRALVGDLATASSGIALLALGSVTPQGFAASLSLGFTRAGACALALLVGRALWQRTGDAALDRVSGLMRAAPGISIAWLLGVLGFGLAGGNVFAALVALIGSAGVAPLATTLTLVVAVVLGLALARSVAVLRGEPHPSWLENPRLEPHGGALPDLRGREVWWAVLLCALLLSATVAPRFWFGVADAGILDLFRALVPAGPTQVS